MMKRCPALLLALALLLGVTGCAGGTDNSDPSTAPTGSSASTTGAAATLPTTAEPTLPTPDTGDIDNQFDVITRIGDTAYEHYYFAVSNADGYAEMLATAAARLNGVATVYDLLIPLSSAVTLPEGVTIEGSDQNAALDYLYNQIRNTAAAKGTSVQWIELLSVLQAHKREYLYFRTDHHWTALSAYYAYQQFALMKGFTPHALSEYKKIEFPGFLGTFYADTGKNPKLAANPDTVTAYVPISNTSLYFIDQNGANTPWQVITDVSDWSASFKYNTFIGGDNPYTEITNNDLHDGSACVVVKESFGNAFVPFLADHYEKVYAIDYRYYKEKSLEQVVREKGATDVIFVNAINAAGGARLSLMEDLVNR